MEVLLTPDVEKKLNEHAAQSGRAASEVLQDALAGYFEEVAETRRAIDRRYDELRAGTVKPIPGDQVESHFREKSALALRRMQPGS